VPSLILEPTTDGIASADDSELLVSPKSNSPVNIEAFEILEPGNPQLPALPKLKTPVN